MRGLTMNGTCGGDTSDLHFLQLTFIEWLAALCAHYPLRKVDTLVIPIYA